VLGVFFLLGTARRVACRVPNGVGAGEARVEESDMKGDRPRVVGQ
jgi:hypothetical protein